MPHPKKKAKHHNLSDKPIPGLFFALSLPAIVSMTATLLYNLTDNFFLGLDSGQATAAVGVVFPVMSVIQAIGVAFAIGAGNHISLQLAERRFREAEETVSTTFFTVMLAGIVLMVLGEIFIRPLLLFLGATAAILPAASQYAVVILLSAPLIAGIFVLNTMLRSEGIALSPMLAVLAGVALNILLDPFFIFTLGLGVKGAALGTVAGQLLSFCFLLALYLRRESCLRLSPAYFRPSVALFWDVTRMALPSFFRNILISLALLFLNKVASGYGEAALSSLSFAMRVYTLVISAFIGFGQGYMPVLGYNQARKDYPRMRRVFWFANGVSTAFGLLAAALLFILAEALLRLFINSGDISLGLYALRALALVLPLFGWTVITNMTFQAQLKSLPATFLAVLRHGLFYIPLLFILPDFFGLRGLALSQSLADILTFIITLPFSFYLIRKFKSEDTSASL